MKSSLVLTLIGPDRPGLVEMVSSVLADYDANWQQSSMSRLAGKFAGILIATVDSKKVTSLIVQLKHLEEKGLKVMAEVDETQDDVPAGSKALVLELIGLDKPGIVHELSHLLAERKISVERLETEVNSGSMSAEPVFKAQANLIAPGDIDLDELQDALEAIAADLMVEIHLD